MSCTPQEAVPLLALFVSYSLVCFIVAWYAYKVWHLDYTRHDVVAGTLLVLLMSVSLVTKNVFQWNANRFQTCCLRHVFVADTLGSMPSTHVALVTFLVVFYARPYALTLWHRAPPLLPTGDVPLPPLPPPMARSTAGVRFSIIVVYGVGVCWARIALNLASFMDAVGGFLLGVTFVAFERWFTHQVDRTAPPEIKAE